jgi:acyl carrier protein
MGGSQTFDERLLAVFRRVFRRDLNAQTLGVGDLEEWDSLSHIKLVIELERDFEIAIDPDDIPALFSNFETVREYVRSRVF